MTFCELINELFFWGVQVDTKILIDHLIKRLIDPESLDLFHEKKVISRM